MMNFKFNLLLFLCCCLFQFAHAQNTQNDEKQKYLSIGISPLTVLEHITPTLEGTLDLHLTKNLSIETKIGLPFEHLALIQGANRSNEKYQDVKLGVKYFFVSKRPDIFVKPFFGLEYFRVNHNYTYNNRWYRNNMDEFIHVFDKAEVHRTINGLRVKNGFLIEIKQKWTVELYQGLGFRRMNIEYTNIINEELVNNELGLYWDEWFAPIDRIEEARVKLDLQVGFTFAYKLFKW